MSCRCVSLQRAPLAIVRRPTRSPHLIPRARMATSTRTARVPFEQHTEAARQQQRRSQREEDSQAIALLDTLQQHAKRGEVAEAEACAEKLRRELLTMPMEAYEHLAFGYVTNRALDKAEELLTKIKSNGRIPSQRIYTTLILGSLAQLPRVAGLRRSMDYWKEMQRLDLALTPQALGALLMAIYGRGEELYTEESVTLLRLLLSADMDVSFTTWQQIVVRLSYLRPVHPQLSSVLTYMERKRIPLAEDTIRTLLRQRIKFSAATLRYLANISNGRIFTSIIGRLADEDWEVAIATYEARPIGALAPKPLSLLVHAPNPDGLRRSVQAIEAAQGAPLVEADFVWCFGRAYGKRFKPPAPHLLDWIYNLWLARRPDISEALLEQALQGLIDASPAHPIAERLWADRIALPKDLPSALLETLFTAIDIGASKWVGPTFTALLQRNKITAALVQEYVRLTPSKTGRIAEVIASLPRTVPHTAISLNALARGAAEELDVPMCLELIEQAKYLMFTVDLATWDAMVRMYAKADKPMDALRVLQEVHDRSPFGSPGVPSEATANSVLAALVRLQYYPDAAKFYQRMHCALYASTLATVLRGLVNVNVKFALEILEDALAGRLVYDGEHELSTRVVLRRLCARMLKAAREADNRTARTHVRSMCLPFDCNAIHQIIVWMQRHKIGIREEREDDEDDGKL